MAVFLESGTRDLVTTRASHEEASDPPDGGQAHAGELMNLPVGQAVLQAIDHRPSIRHCLDLRRGAQVAQEGTDLFRALQGSERGAQIALRQGFLAGGKDAVWLHGRSNVLVG